MATMTDQDRDMVSSGRFQHPSGSGEDRKLVDLTNTVLVDPNLHTDTRQRLAEEIKGLIRDAYEVVHREPLPAAHRIPQSATPAEVTDLLTDVLDDPGLHTDLRLGLHRDIVGSLGRLSSLPA